MYELWDNSYREPCPTFGAVVRSFTAKTRGKTVFRGGMPFRSVPGDCGGDGATHLQLRKKGWLYQIRSPAVRDERMPNASVTSVTSELCGEKNTPARPTRHHPRVEGGAAEDTEVTEFARG